MIEGSCHCCAVRIAVPEKPAELTSCNCSLCRRNGGLWAYYLSDQVIVTGETDTYIQGDRTLATHSCPTCHCTTHWKGLDLESVRMGVNMRMMDPADIEGVPIKRIDGADTWKVLD